MGIVATDLPARGICTMAGTEDFRPNWLLCAVRRSIAERTKKEPEDPVCSSKMRQQVPNQTQLMPFGAGICARGIQARYWHVL
jgi:hypothetical protein